MLFLLMVFLVFAVSLTMLLWVGSLFFQGYIYTEPSPGLFWQAPAAGVALALYFTFWTWLVQGSASAHDVTYDTLFRFSPQVEKTKEPVKRLLVVKKDDKEEKAPVAYHRKRIDQTRYEYRDAADRRYSSLNVKAILIPEEDGSQTRLEPGPPRDGPYRQFVDKSGWTMMEYETGPTGQLVAFRFGRFVINLLLNFLHFLLWFVCLWLLLRFTWAHAFGFAIVLWLVTTLTVLPMVLSQAATPTATVRSGGSQIRK